MKLMDPTVASTQPDATRAPRCTSLDGKVIGILSNGKANADLLLSETAKRFAAEYGCEIRSIVYKSNPSAPSPEETITQLADDCDLLLTANGD